MGNDRGFARARSRDYQQRAFAPNNRLFLLFIEVRYAEHFFIITQRPYPKKLIEPL